MQKKEKPVAIRPNHVVTYRCDFILNNPALDPTTCLDVELAFTETHKKYQTAPPAVREAHCLAVEYPALFRGIQKGDLIPGWLEHDCVGIGLENNSGGVAYYCYNDIIDDLLGRVPFSDEKRRAILDMQAYWRRHATFAFPAISLPGPEKAEKFAFKDAGEGEDAQPMFALDPECAMARFLKERGFDDTVPKLGFQGARLAGVNINFDKLLQKGVKGLLAEISDYEGKAAPDKKPFYEGLRLAMETLQNTLRWFAQDAAHQLEDPGVASDPAWKKELETYQEMFNRLAEDKPYSFRSAIQLFWIYHWMSRVVNFSRMDIFLGDFLAADLDQGLITEDYAQSLVNELWRLIAAKKVIMNCRVIIGGMGRRNEKNADRFALLAMQASREVAETEPQLTLRFYEGQNPLLMEKAYDNIGNGVVYPMLFNDDVNVPAVEHAYGASREDAQWYLPYGCGEYGIEHLSLGSPNGGLQVYSLLEMMIFNGKTTYGYTGSIPITKKFEDYQDFEEFYRDFAGYQKKYFAYQAKKQRMEHEVDARELAFLYCTALTDDCLPRGLSISGGGARYLGGVVETFGLVDAADSMAAIKYFVFEKKIFTPQQMREMLHANFAGYEKERKMLTEFAKFGNDNDYADEILCRMSDDMCKAYNMSAKDAGLDYFLACNVNNRENVRMGKMTPAMPSGRLAGAPMANGNTPTAGNDKSGITAFLKSAAKVKHDNNSGYTHNMKFSKSMFNNERPKVKSLLSTYFGMGGSSAMITCVGKDDLQRAQKNPEEYKNLMVRVGGFSARFVELEPELQEDIINRTLY
jgi:pyruvate-formate lyase